MSLLRRAARTDANQAELVKALHKVGGLWIPIGYPFDGLAGFGGRWIAIEIKDGAKVASKRKLKPSQVEFFRDCAAYRLPAAKVESVDELLQAIGAVR
jgi:hypothetical protein